MKIRTDFVSNSSSSSFVIWGVNISDSNIIKAFQNDISEEQYNKAKSKWDPAYEDLINDLDNGESFYELSDFIEKTCKVEVIRDSYDNMFYIGFSPDKMHGTETLNDFKDRIKTTISQKFPSVKLGDVKLYKGVDADGEISLD